MALTFLVSKFIPTHCPLCLNPFQENADGENGFLIWTFWKEQNDQREKLFARSIGWATEPSEPTTFAFAAPLDSANVYHQSTLTDMIRCGKCRNVTLRFIFERRLCTDRAEAERLIAEEGFTILQGAVSDGRVQRGHKAIIEIRSLGMIEVDQ